MEVLGFLLVRALNHHELDAVNLALVVLSELLHNLALFQVPNDHGAILRPRSHVPVALTDGKVDDHVRVAMERCLQNERGGVPNFNDSKLKLIG